MADEEQRRIFAKNLNYYLEQSGKTQADVAKAIGVSPQTFNTWCQGIAIPRMGKVQLLADYFGIGKTDLIDEKPISGYYFNEETAKVAQEIFDNKELHILFDATRDASPEDLKALQTMALALKRKGSGNTDDTGC